MFSLNFSNSSSGSAGAAGVPGTGQSIFARSVFSSASTESSAASTTAASSSGADELPPGWRLMNSRSSGKDYYLHLATGRAQWERPTEGDNGAHKQQTNVANAFTSVARVGVAMFNQRFQQGKAGTVGMVSGQRTPSARGSNTEAEREGQQLAEIYENERLDGKSRTSDPKRYCDRDAGGGEGYDEMPEGELPDGHEWVTEWEVDPNFTAVDRDGWTYAADFAEIVRLVREDLSHASRHPSDSVRRRRWIRYSQPIQGGATPTSAATTPTEASKTPSGPNPSLTSWGTDSAVEKSPERGSEDIDDDDDPFFRTAQKAQTGFRVNMKFTHRGGKDNTKDYQSITLGDVEWLVSASDSTDAPTDEMMREKTANLEERIKEAITRSSKVETELRAEHDRRARELEQQKQKLGDLIVEYQRVREENEALQARVAAHRETVEALRKEATEKDIMLNEEQRALNAEMTAANQALEEKAKALATARMRYKRDNKSLAEQVEDAKKRLEQQKAKTDTDAQDPISKELKEEMEKVRQLHAKLEAVRQHRLAVEEESKTLFNLVVEKKADLKFKAKKKLEHALKEVDEKINAMKEEQAALTKKLAGQVEGDELRQLNTRRNEIRSELGALKERRAMLLAKKRRHEGND